jgi:probable F420-dependent oxidoreductase
VKFSVLVPHINWTASPAALRDVAQAAEGLGFEGLAVADHIHYAGNYIATGSRTPVEGGDPRNLYESLETLAFLAGITTRVKLLPTVLVAPLREPVLAAKQLATIDALSEGRLIVGVGVGRPTKSYTDAALVNEKHRTSAEQQYKAYGLTRNRSRLMDEILEAWIAIWTQDLATYHGTHVDFDEVPIFPKPVQRPYPPIWVGGRSEYALDRIAAYGDVWIPSQPNPEQYREGMIGLRERFAERGRPAPTEFAINLFTSLSEDAAAAREITFDAVGQIFANEEEFGLRTIAGDKAFWIERLRLWASIGVTHVDIKPIYRTIPELLECLRVIAEEIAPEIEAPAAA